jgi:anti-sigma factor RsiW
MTGERSHPSEEQLSEYLDGRLDPGTSAAIATHLGDCRVCADGYAALRGTVSLLQRLPTLAAPRDFRLGPRPQASPRGAWVLRLYPWTRLASAAAAVLFVVLFALDFAVLAPQPAARSEVVAPAGQGVGDAPETSSASAVAVATSEARDAAASATAEKGFSASDLTMQPLPTLAPTPQAEPAAGPHVATVGRARPTLWPWEALALGLAGLFALATWLLSRQASSHRAAP